VHEVAVGALDEMVRLVERPGRGRHPGGDAQVGAGPDVRRSHRSHDRVGDPPGLVMGGVWEHDGELLAADAADGVPGAGVGPQDLGEGAALSQAAWPNASLIVFGSMTRA
jgi:hypothetical protein